MIENDMSGLYSRILANFPKPVLISEFPGSSPILRIRADASILLTLLPVSLETSSLPVITSAGSSAG